MLNCSFVPIRYTCITQFWWLLHSNLYSLFLYMFSFMYMLLLSKLIVYMYILESIAFHAIYYCGLVYVWICIYTLVYTKHIYVLKFVLFWWKLNFYVFHVCKGISFEFKCLIFMILLITWFLHSIFGVYSWLYFHEHICAL